ncbi:glycoside hydrolase family 78 protein [Pedobacter sp. MC2016-14]|uniref:glycoside hydrolase family 78 protein n=1 Tax=Pedobacter sp. MC2016-14 TaxID=2897327 RepID=UPI001E58E977|nr:glycoside hydrolase family 78 protein [Pedobacter sp. MC2016-14]MCD0486669.1 glycoside hydrolase family 78 protein [Pedobacter sp. MC2016-14]
MKLTKYISKCIPVFSIGLLFSFPSVAQKLSVAALVCEYQTNPIGIDVVKPRLSWKLKSSGQDILQTSYELRMSKDSAQLKNGKNLSWTSGKVKSASSVHIMYNGPALASAQRNYWQVRVWDNKGNVSKWSDCNYWEMGLLKTSDWTAEWIKSNIPADTVDGPAPMFRRSFELAKAVKSARLYITAHGIFEAYLNGKRIGDEYFAPGWTSYRKRLQYQVYDVTSLLNKGKNAAGVMVGDGWYRGHLDKWKNIYGKDLALLYQLEVQYTDGTKETIASNKQWKAAIGPIRSSSFYNGEVYDTRLEKKGWNMSAYNDKGWLPVTTAVYDNSILVAPEMPPVRKKEVFHPLKLIKTPKGETVIDFGQNLVGWVVIDIKGKLGDVITIKHAEVLDKEGNFYTANLRFAKSELKYILASNQVEHHEPHFTYQGFRYIKIEGFTGKLDTAGIRAVAMYSDMEATGNLVTSNPMLNQLQHNIQWGQKGNFVDVPTDCPQRNERLGWTGDAQAFSRTAEYNMNVAGFFTRWLKDLSADQHADGAVTWVVPDIMSPTAAGVAGWADAATIIPWSLYQTYGDKHILEQQYPGMKAWIGYMEQKSINDLWNTGFHFGDWCFYSPSPTDDSGKAAVTDKYLIAQAFYANSVQLMINTAEVLGKDEDVKKYQALLEKIKKAFVKEYVTGNGRVVSGTQTAMALTLSFDLLPENLRDQLAGRLVENIKAYGNHLTTGFLGTPYLCHVLSRFGYDDMAYTLLLQDTYPSWLYPVTKGATTIWERWDGIKANGDLQDPSMNSFNHYSYGAIGDWMYRRMAGLDTDTKNPGYKGITIAPHPGGDLSMVNATLETMYGKLQSKWQLKNGLFILDVVVPPNTTAEVILPNAANTEVTHNLVVSTLKKAVKSGKDLKYPVGSGSYHFEYHFKP